jgi:hypothetical protein
MILLLLPQHADLAVQELAWQVQQVKASLQAAGG